MRSFLNSDKRFWKSTTGIGLKGEAYVAKLLGARMLLFNKNGADLDWNGVLIDVKTANLSFRKNKRGMPVKSTQRGLWVFKNTGVEKPLDFVFCVGIDAEGRIAKLLLIPASEYPKQGASVGWKSKWDRFKYDRHTAS